MREDDANLLDIVEPQLSLVVYEAPFDDGFHKVGVKKKRGIFSKKKKNINACGSLSYRGIIGLL